MLVANSRKRLTLSQKKKGDNGQKVSRPAQALNMIRQLYAIERRIKSKTTEERYQVRQSESRPIMEKFWKWLEK